MNNEKLRFAGALSQLPDSVTITIETTDRVTYPEPPILTIEPHFLRELAQVYVGSQSAFIDRLTEEMEKGLSGAPDNITTQENTK